MEDYFAASNLDGEKFYLCHCPECGGWVEYDPESMRYICTKCDWWREEF